MYLLQKFSLPGRNFSSGLSLRTGLEARGCFLLLILVTEVVEISSYELPPQLLLVAEVEAFNLLAGIQNVR